MDTTKCKSCGKSVQISRDGWLVDSFVMGKREVRYTHWFHVVGHLHTNGKLCPGSGADPTARGLTPRAADSPKAGEFCQPDTVKSESVLPASSG